MLVMTEIAVEGLSIMGGMMRIHLKVRGSRRQFLQIAVTNETVLADRRFGRSGHPVASVAGNSEKLMGMAQGHLSPKPHRRRRMAPPAAK